MYKIPVTMRFPIFCALLLHLLILFLFLIKPSENTFQLTQASKNPTKIMHVMAVSQQQIDAQINHIVQEKAKIKAAKIAREKRRHEKIVALEKARIKRLQQKKARVLREKKRRLQLAKARREKALRLKQKKARAEKEKRLLAAQRKLQEKLMQQQMHSEQRVLKQINAKAQQGIVDQFKARVLAVIQSNWRIAQVDAKLQCVYDVSIAPGGVVLSARLVKSSGNAALDQSAKVAILKSSPLPVPKNPALFDRFRQLVLTLSPQGYV